MELKTLCVELQSLGVRVPKQMQGRRGGAGPAEGSVLILDGLHINVPTQSWYVGRSPYRIEKKQTAFVLLKNDAAVCEVSLPARPKYYDVATESGISLEKLALVHGRDCFASTVYQNCAYWSTELQCRFCGIGLSLKNGTSVLKKKPDDLAFAAEQAQQLDGIKHVTLTTGLWADENEGLNYLEQSVKKIKEKTKLPIHVQICPTREKDAFVKLKEAGADTAGIHIETGSYDILQRVAPGKFLLGLKTYIECWSRAVSVFGRNQVSSFIIAGFGEPSDDILKTAELLSSLGVFPYLLPLRPIPGTLMENSSPPKPDDMMYLYDQIASILNKHGLSSRESKAGCVRCGSCSSLRFFEGSRH